MSTLEFLDKHIFGIGLILVLIWPGFKFEWRSKCKCCGAAKAKPELDSE